jgi:hypothetical protein
MFEITTGGQAPWALELQAEPMLNEHDAFIDMLLRVPSPRPTLLGEKSGQNARLLCITAGDCCASLQRHLLFTHRRGAGDFTRGAPAEYLELMQATARFTSCRVASTIFILQYCLMIALMRCSCAALTTNLIVPHSKLFF